MVKNISADRLKGLLEQDPNVVVIDVRTPGEVAAGTIPGARNINLFDPNFMENLKELEKNKTYVMFCQSGNRSASAAGCMLHLGFSNVFNAEGGIMSWRGGIVYAADAA